MRRVYGLVMLLALLPGCASLTGGEDNSEQPAALKPIENAIQLKELWSEPFGDGNEGKAVNLLLGYNQGRIYTVDRGGHLFTVDAKTGKLVWKQALGIIASAGPYVTEQNIVIGTQDAEVITLGKSDGKVLWRTTMTSEILSLPQQSQGIVVVRAVDGKVTGLDSTSGKILWNYDDSVPPLTLRGASKPVIVGNQVLVGFDSGKLTALSLHSGRVVWQRSIATPHGRSELERIVDIDANPLVIGDTIFVTTFQGNLSAVSLATGKLIWTREMSAYEDLAFAGELVFLSDEHSEIWAVHGSNGASVWKQNALRARALTSPVVYGKYIVVGDYDGYLHWLNQENGELVARIKFDDEAIVAKPIVVEDTLYVLGNSGKIAAFRSQEG